MSGEEAVKVKANNFGEVPAWFAPNAAVDYDIWVFEGEPDRNFKILIDKGSAIIFLSDYQV